MVEGSGLLKILAEGRRVRGRVRRGYVAARRIQEIQDFEKQSGKNEVTWGKKWLGTTKKSSKRVFGAQGEPPRGSQESQAIGKARRNEKKRVGKGPKVVGYHREECQEGTWHPEYKFWEARRNEMSWKGSKSGWLSRKVKRH